MGVFNELGKALQVKARRLDHVAVVDGIPHDARKAVPQQIEMTRGPLDIRQSRGVRGFQEIKPRAAHDRKPKIPQQLLIMLLADAVEIHDLAVQVI